MIHFKLNKSNLLKNTHIHRNHHGTKAVQKPFGNKSLLHLRLTGDKNQLFTHLERIFVSFFVFTSNCQYFLSVSDANCDRFMHAKPLESKMPLCDWRGGSSSHPGVICRLSQYGVRKVRKLGSAVMYYIKSELRVLLWAMRWEKWQQMWKCFTVL